MLVGLSGFYKRGCQEKTLSLNRREGIFSCHPAPLAAVILCAGARFAVSLLWKGLGVMFIGFFVVASLRLQAAGWRLPTKVLSETRGLWLCWVVRGGIRCPVRLRLVRRGLTRNKLISSTKQGVVMEFYGLPPIGQKQRRPMDGAQFHSPWVGNAGGGLIRNRVSNGPGLND
jgi:hypothetical protein